MPRKRSGFSNANTQGGRKRCDSGKLDYKGPKYSTNYDSQTSIGKEGSTLKNPTSRLHTNTSFRFKKTTSSSALKSQNKVKKVNSDLDAFWDPNNNLEPAIAR